MKWMALDIGGANLKAADGEKFAVTQPFALWEKPSQLAEALRAILALVPRADHVAATMTGELADCFANKTEGVEFIIGALVTAADGRHTRIYQTNGMLVTPQVALRQPHLAAASNWHALAKFAGRYARRGSALLIDIGSTTCDIIPLQDGVPTAAGKNDPERLLNGELVYTGVQRSPICALVGELPWRGNGCPVAQELFATSWDVYLVRGDLPEEPLSLNTADRRPATKEAARDRLARAICADRGMVDEADTRAAAEFVAAAQLSKIVMAAGRVLALMPQEPQTVILSGRGEFLARRVMEQLIEAPRVVSLSQELGEELSQCACAHALAVLAKEGVR